MNEVIERDASTMPVQQGGPVTPMQLLQIATQQGADIEKLTQLMALQERWEANEARKAFHKAFAAFKAETVTVLRNTPIKAGPLAGKSYADLFAVVGAVTPALSKHGLSASWRLSKDEKEWLEVTCTITHSLGHSESVSMGAGPDAGGAKNGIQARASTVTYLERYTLMAATGLAAKDQDNDGAGARGGLDESTFADFVTAIDGAADADSLANIWKTAVKACNDAKDTESYDALKKQVTLRGEQLKGTAKRTVKA